MKSFNAICATLVLVLFLSIPTYADTNPGDGHGPGRSISEPSELWTPTGDAGLADADETASGDGSLMADILWALTSMY